MRKSRTASLSRTASASPADTVHIVMELYRGGGLFDDIVEKSRQSRSSRSLGGSILDIVHRDIKPENILFSEQGGSDSDATRMSFVRLINFGIDLNDVSTTSSLSPKVVTMDNGRHQTRRPRRVRLHHAGWRDRNGIEVCTCLVYAFVNSLIIYLILLLCT